MIGWDIINHTSPLAMRKTCEPIEICEAQEAIQAQYSWDSPRFMSYVVRGPDASSKILWRFTKLGSISWTQTILMSIMKWDLMGFGMGNEIPLEDGIGGK